MKITFFQIDFILRVKNDSKMIFYINRCGRFAKKKVIFEKKMFVRVNTINFVKKVYS